MENKIKELINEFRLRIRNLDTYPDDSYLLGVVSIADWLFKVKEFTPAFEKLENQKNHQNQILNKVEKELFKEIKKQWEVLKKYITKKILSKLSEERFNFSNEKIGAKFFIEGNKGSKFKLLRMEQMMEEKVRFYVVDAYHELRLLTEQIYHSSYKNEILKNNLIIFGKDKQIKNFVSNSVFDVFKNFIDTETEIKKKNKFSPLETYVYLKQLLTLREQNDWRWQLKEWRRLFGKDFYTPRLYELSNFLESYFSRQENLEDRDFFYWSNDCTFKVKMSSSIESIPFYPKDGLNTCYLLKAMTQKLLSNGEYNGQWLEVWIDNVFVKEYIENTYGKECDDNWIRYTKSNLKRKIPYTLKDTIKIGYQDRKRKAFLFGIKKPNK
jgi:hypothetical protein